MPMQRYEGGATPFQQVDPTAAKESAQMFNSLSQRLESWQNTLFDIGKVEAAENGRQQAINDLASGQQARIEKGYSFYDRAYNDVSKAAYNVKVESDLKQAAEMFSAKHTLDPKAFQETFGAYANQTVKGVQEPEFKVLAMQAGQKLLGTYTANIAKEAFKVQRENDEKAINAGIKELGNQYESSYANADEFGMNESLAKINALYQRKIDAGLINPELAGIEMKELGKRAVKTKIYKEHSNALIDKNNSYFTDFLASEQYKSMDVEDQNEVRKKMQSQIEEFHKAKLTATKNAVEELDLIAKDTYNTYESRIINGQKVTEEEIKQLISERKITPDLGDKLLDHTHALSFGAERDNEYVKMKYMASLESTSPETIMHDHRLTAKTKSELIRQIESRRDAMALQVSMIKALANKSKYEQLMFGDDAWSQVDDMLFSNIRTGDRDNDYKVIFKIKDDLRKDIRNGKYNYDNILDGAKQKYESYQNRLKEVSASTTYDDEVIEYNKKVKAYNKAKNEYFTKELPHPGPPPKKPSKYIPEKARY